jgi:hypothetical protein
VDCRPDAQAEGDEAGRNDGKRSADQWLGLPWCCIACSAIPEYSFHFPPSFSRGMSENWDAVGKAGWEWELPSDEGLEPGRPPGSQPQTSFPRKRNGVAQRPKPQLSTMGYRVSHAEARMILCKVPYCDITRVRQRRYLSRSI